MNLQQIRKNLGQNLHLRPIPHRVGDAGQRLPAIDDLWRLDGILDEPARLRLVNISTHHLIELQPDNIREYRSPHFLSTIGTGALTRARPLRVSDVLIVALGWVGTIALAVYAAALGG
jgi:hypothetical protein